MDLARELHLFEVNWVTDEFQQLALDAASSAASDDCPSVPS